MDPDKYIGGAFLALALGGVGLLRKDELTPEQRERARQEREGEERAAAIERRLASPIAAAAEAKRERKRARLAAIVTQEPK